MKAEEAVKVGLDFLKALYGDKLKQAKVKSIKLESEGIENVWYVTYEVRILKGAFFFCEHYIVKDLTLKIDDVTKRVIEYVDTGQGREEQICI